MPETTNRYDIYVGFFVVGIVLFILSLFAGWLETLYAVFFFLASADVILSTQKPKSDPNHSTVTHFEIYSRNNVFNYILAAIVIVEVVIYLILPIHKAILIFALWTFNIMAYPRFLRYFSTRLSLNLVSAYLKEQVPELDIAQISKAVAKLNSKSGADIAELTKLGMSSTQAERLQTLYTTYLETNLT
jgi:hypothetical protein